MSVLKSKRSTSKAEYVNLAGEIFTETMAFLTRLSSRYSRLLAGPVAELAGEVMGQTEKANSIFPKGEPNMSQRKGHLLEARAALMALDVRLGYCFSIMALNPQGCFTTGGGRYWMEHGNRKAVPISPFGSVERYGLLMHRTLQIGKFTRPFTMKFLCHCITPV